MPLLPAPADNAAMEAEPPKRRRRWYQFSLRTLLIGVVIVSIPCAWLGRKIEQKRKEQDDVRAIKLLNGAAHYDYLVEKSRTPHGPAWLRSILGENFFSNVAIVNLIENRELSDSDLTHLEGFSGLTWLDLSFSHKISDAGLRHIRGLAKLEHLDLSGTTITDSGLEYLQELRRLRELRLIGTRIGDAGLKQIKNFTRLRELNLDLTCVTDAGLKDLCGMTDLKELDLIETPVTDAGASSLLVTLPNCRVVFGSRNSVKSQRSMTRQE